MQTIAGMFDIDLLLYLYYITCIYILIFVASHHDIDDFPMRREIVGAFLQYCAKVEFAITSIEVSITCYYLFVKYIL